MNEILEEPVLTEVAPDEPVDAAPVRRSFRIGRLFAGIGIGLAAVIAVIVIFFLIMFYSPWMPEARDQYIMMTYHTSNPWLCTWFFSEETIEKVLADNTIVEPEGEINTDLIQTTPGGDTQPGDDPSGGSEIEQGPTTDPEPEKPDYASRPFTESEKYVGEILYDDGEVRVREFSGTTKKGVYTARLIQVKDPSRVFLGLTNQLGDASNPEGSPGRGQLILDLCKDNNALCGINAGGFVDVGGYGTGGIPTECVVKDGEILVFDDDEVHDIIGFNEDNVLILGSFTNEQIKEKKIRDAMSWKPILILNGEKASTKGLSGGFDPRSAIGQCADGTVLLLQVDGSVRRSIDGANMALLMDILWEYGAVNAANLDGGTSSIAALENRIISTVCNPTIVHRGRRLPTAWLVREKTEESTPTTTVSQP